MHSRIKRNGSSRKWRALRQAILKRDNNTCYFCGIPTATTVDHLTPIDKGGDNQIISLLLVQIATTLKAIEQKNSTSKTETTRLEDK